jgi:hypothetical protein
MRWQTFGKDNQDEEYQKDGKIPSGQSSYCWNEAFNAAGQLHSD